MPIRLVQIIEFDIFRHSIEIMKGRQDEADAAVTPAAAQDIHAEGGPCGVQKKICKTCLLALLLHFLRCQRRIKIQFAEIMIKTIERELLKEE